MKTIPFLRLTIASVVAGLAFALPARAQMALRGGLLLEEYFRRHAEFTKEKLPLKEGWTARVAHGTWKRSADGLLVSWESGHQPVLVLEGAFGDAIIELEFRYREEPGKWAACRVSATNQVLNPRADAASVWANIDYKSRAVGLVLEHDEWSPGHITQVSRKLTEFKPDTWHTLRLEIIGNTVLTTCNGVTVVGTYEKFGIPKSSIWLATGLSTHELRNLRVFEAKSNPAWPPKAEAKVPASAPKKTG
jgi:hypothetical protein